MENKFENIDEVIARFLSGESTEPDRRLLQEWRELSEENNREYLQFEKIFSASGELRNALSVDTDVAWQKVHSKIAMPEEKGKVISLQASSSRLSFLRIAASILILIGAGLSVYFFINHSRGEETVIASADSTRSLVLPDSSTIILNKNSQIAYSIDHFSGKRVVKLKGEAFFNVIHDEKNPFMVEAADLKIQDIGTSFNVRAEEGEDLIVVSVISGEVSLTTINNESITLHRGEEAHYHLSTRKFEQDTELDPNISAYTNRIFVFDNAELSTVIRTLNDVYSNKFSIDNDVLKSCRITVTFDDETPESIASVITETLGIQYKKENNQIIFFGNGCK